MKRRSFLLSLLAPALAFLGIGRDAELRAMVLESPWGKVVFPKVLIRQTFPIQIDDESVEFLVETLTEPYVSFTVAPRSTEGDPF